MNARLQLLRRKLGQSGGARVGVAQRSERSPAPLSSAQQRMWLHQELHPDSSAYNVSIRIDLAGELDENRLVAALQAVVARHDLLRSTYKRDANGVPHQQINDSLPAEVTIVEDRAPEELASEVAAMPFDLAHAGPIRMHLLRHGGARWTMILTVHHIIWDGGCFGILSADLSRAYRGLHQEPPSLQYADFAADEAARSAQLPSPLMEGQLTYWRNRLSPLPPALSLPTLRPMSPELGEAADRTDRQTPVACANALRDLADRLGATPFAVFMAVYALLLHRWSGERDITIGTMIANRHQPGAAELIGNFGNTVLLRMNVDPDASFASFVALAQSTILDGLSHGDIPIERLAETLAPPRAAGHGVFTDTLGLFLDRDIGGPDLPGVEVAWDNVFNGASPFALTFQGFLTGDRLKVEVTHRRDLFDAATIVRMLDHFEAILLAAQREPNRDCTTVAALPAAQTKALLAQSTGPRQPLPDRTILDQWRMRVAAAPEGLAVICSGQSYSNAELDRLVNRLAQALRMGGLVAEAPVAVALRRGLAACVAPLAIWKAGGVYFPFNPDHPPARLNVLLAEAGAYHVICDRDPGLVAAAVLQPERIWTEPGSSEVDPGQQPDLLAAAHVSFTSGSTGRPKGVLSTHGALAARTGWVAKHWPAGSGETRAARLGKSTPTSIDAVAELCEAWAAGDVLVVANDDEARDAVRLSELLKQHDIAHFMAVPGLLDAMTTAKPEILRACDRVLSTGEPLLPQVARLLLARAPGLRLFNSYGCSETTGDVMAGPVQVEDPSKRTLPIGEPLPGSRCYVLTPDLSLAPQDVLGELYIAGPQLARGYLGQPGLTAERFVASPFASGERLYRSGDLARWRSDGRLELAGRGDDQVNVRGHRVEPSETQAALMKLDGVAEAAVLPRMRRGTFELVAFVTGEEGAQPDPVQLKAALAKCLPGPFVPAEIVPLPALPRLGGGKIDRQALLDREPAGVAHDAGRMPQGSTELALAGILCDLLERDRIGAEDNFFALGGDSMAALTFAARANARGLAVAAATVFQYPTIAEIAAQLDAGRPAEIAEAAENRRTQRNLMPIVHRMRLSGLVSEELLSWRALRYPLEVADFRQRLERLFAGHPHLAQPLTQRGRLWRLKDRDTPPSAFVLACSDADLSSALQCAQSHVRPGNGQGVIGVHLPGQSLIAAHPAILDGWGLSAAAAEIEARGLKTPRLPTMSLTDECWRDQLADADQCRWWMGPQDVPPVALMHGLARECHAEHLNSTDILRQFTASLLRLSGAPRVLVDLELPATVPGPMQVVPVCARMGGQVTVGTGESFLRFRGTDRPQAGGPGILLRPGGSGAAPLPGGRACGAEQLYRMVASWEITPKGRLALSLRGSDRNEMEALLDMWAEALIPDEVADVR